MCGIAGFFDPRPADLDQRRALVSAMLSTLQHRGPDGAGVFVEGPVALGCQRLAIVDVAGGHQPVVHEQVALVCNGEVYEHEAIRAQAQGYPFTSRADVEVLAWLFTERGDDLLHDLEAQLALALYDRPRQRLLLARDAFGIAPLYWAQLPGGGLAFASEIKALLVHPEISARLDLVGVDQVFAFPGLVSPRTAFVGIQSLPPGHQLAVDAGGLQARAWWDLRWPEQSAPPATARTDEEWAEALAEALARAVRRRMMGEVPVGCYLSGGLDSSLLLALCAAQAPARDCFSIGFAQGAVDERAFQRAVVQATGARHWFTELAVDAIPDHFARMIRHAECPVKESYNVASLLLAQSARAAGVKVVLSGEGADELFAGYPGYRVDALASRHARAEGDFAAMREDDLRAQVFGAPGIFYEGHLDAARALRHGLYAAELLAEPERFDSLEVCAPIVNGERLRGRHRAHQRAYLDVKLRLSDHLLSDHGDRMSMAASVEARYPFLDREVVALATQMPPDVVMRGGQGKAVLRAAARGLLPDAILRRDKMGFHAPGTPTLLACARPWVEEVLAPTRLRQLGIFDPLAVQHLMQVYGQPGFRLDLPLQDDLLMIILSCVALVDEFKMSV
jgi:asparagine synthase (glutamine-hydrolysing)